MNAVDRPQLLQLLRSRRDEIADNWYQAIERASDVPLKATEVRQRLVELTEQIITILATDPFDHNEARSIGAALVHLDHIQPEALCRAQEVLVCQLVQGLPADQVAALQPRLATLIGALATGFFQQTREIMLTEHDQIRSTLIAKRKLAEEALRESREERKELEYIVNHSPAVVFLWRNAEGWPVEFVSDNVRQFGYGPKDFHSGRMPFISIVHPDDLERVAAEVTLYSQEGCGEFTQEYRIITKTGDVRWLDDRTWIRRDLDGVITHYQGIVLDVTERKRAEQQAARAERLAAIGQMGAALAHEVNNPLQAIQANLELAMDFDLEPDEHEKHLHIVRQEIERLAEITRRVLDFARPADDTRYPVSIAHLIQKALQLVGKQLELAHIQVTTDLPADLPPVLAAPDQILQVLLNLSSNAIEAMPDGGHLRIAARADENVVEIALTNDGPPLPAEHIERIFDPFFTTKPDGAGLGLSISHSIVHRHGGTMNVENLKGDQGVTFTITLPIARLV